MRIGLLADVHANLQALETVLAEMERRRITTLWNLGDLVGYGANPDEVVSLLRSRGVVSLLGNYDRKVLQIGAAGKSPAKKAEKRLAFRWAHDALTAENRAYLRSLPQQLQLEVEDLRILLVHGSPTSDEEHLGPETSEERLQQLTALAGADLVASGHSHRAFARRIGRTWFVNPGSVGRSDDSDPRASCAVLHLSRRRVRVEQLRLDYDVEAAAAAIRQAGLPEVFAQMILTGRALDAVLDEPDEEPEERIAADDQRQTIAQVQSYIESLDIDTAHARHVAKLGLRLFDELQPLHSLGAVDRFRLHCAGLLHDIGWVDGGEGHHKSSFRMVMHQTDLPLSKRSRPIIANLARYHRRSLPKHRHRPFATLSRGDQRRVSLLGGMLRLADGLDCNHLQRVRDLRCRISDLRIDLDVVCSEPAKLELLAAQEKGEWLKLLLHRDLNLRIAEVGKRKRSA